MRKQNSNKRIEREGERDEQCIDKLRIWRVKLAEVFKTLLHL